MGEARGLHIVHDPAGQAARHQLGLAQAVGPVWQGGVGARDLAVITDDADQQLGEPFGQMRIKLGQFGSQRVARDPDPVIDRLPPRVLLLILKLVAPLAQAQGRLQAVAPEGDIFHAAAGRAQLGLRQGRVEGVMAGLRGLKAGAPDAKPVGRP